MHASCRLRMSSKLDSKLGQRRPQCETCRLGERVRNLQERAQYLHQFVMHAALDAVDEQLWSTSSMHLGVVDRFNNLQASGPANLSIPNKPSLLN
jgi:Sedlin, N-terminal conserved region